MKAYEMGDQRGPPSLRSSERSEPMAGPGEILENYAALA